MTKSKRKWSELSPRGKAGIVALMIGHFALVGVAHADLSKRPAEQIHGPKWLWRMLTAANTSFTVAYLVWGRHKKADRLALPSGR